MLRMTRTPSRTHARGARPWLLALLSLALIAPTLVACNQAGELRDAAENAAEEAADKAGEAAEGAAGAVGDVAEGPAGAVGDAAEGAADAAGAAAGAAAGMAGAALGKLGDFLGGWRDEVNLTMSGMEADAAAVVADPQLLDDPEWRQAADAKVATLRDQTVALRAQAAEADAETMASLEAQADALDTAAMDYEAALETGDVDALSAAAGSLASVREGLASVFEALNVDLLDVAGEAAEGAKDAAAGAAAGAAAMAGSALGKLGGFLGGWMGDVEAASSELEAGAEAVKADPSLLEDPAWRADAEAGVLSLREKATALREQLADADEDTAAALSAQADALDAAADDYAMALENNDIDGLGTAAAGLAGMRDALTGALEALNVDLIGVAGDAAEGLKESAMGAAGALSGLAGVLQGWQLGTTDAIGTLEIGAGELESDPSLLEDEGWLARMREALAAVRADLPEGGDASPQVQAALADWQSESAMLADEIEAALEAGDSDALRLAIGRLRDAGTTAFGPGGDFSERPLAGGEESLPVDPVSNDDDDDDESDAVTEGEPEDEGETGAATESESEDVEKPATLPRTGAGVPSSLPAMLTLLGMALMAAGVFLRRANTAVAVSARR